MRHAGGCRSVPARCIPRIRTHHTVHGKDERSDEQDGGDPHLWLDFSYDQTIVDNIATMFTAGDPEQKDYYFNNAEVYKGEAGRT